VSVLDWLKKFVGAESETAQEPESGAPGVSVPADSPGDQTGEEMAKKKNGAAAAGKNTGGRLNAKVVGVSKADFTLLIDAGGHEDHGKEITLPVAMWNGPGAVCGDGKALGYEPYPEENPRAKPQFGDACYYEADQV
jgi:hypothetical protein